MAQVTIDDIEYNNAVVQQHLTYQLQCVTAVSNNATGQLKASLTTSSSAPDDAAS